MGKEVVRRGLKLKSDANGGKEAVKARRREGGPWGISICGLSPSSFSLPFRGLYFHDKSRDLVRWVVRNEDLGVASTTEVEGGGSSSPLFDGASDGHRFTSGAGHSFNWKRILNFF
ncbi:hypothetical protein L484_020589 [Morus notabilis]|uniref:Uncharacterized protein n=1 Tax=Morus notabilis TaxID=981085 RepID=W9SJE7_9ROSA|nr:hypothetical protein L484_020589 [Morus notabilis]